MLFHSTSGGKFQTIRIIAKNANVLRHSSLLDPITLKDFLIYKIHLNLYAEVTVRMQTEQYKYCGSIQVVFIRAFLSCTPLSNISTGHE